MENNKKIEEILKKAQELGVNFDLNDLDYNSIDDAKLEKDMDGEWRLLITYFKSL